MRPSMPARRCAAPAVTVLLQPGDNWMMHVAAEQIQPGRRRGGGLHHREHRRLFGDLLATSFRARGAKRLIIDAGCRDVKTSPRCSFPVWSKAISSKGTIKATLGR
jgi:4-hydroxy-4-methyl-2-oxoglutarate aldolase